MVFGWRNLDPVGHPDTSAIRATNHSEKDLDGGNASRFHRH